MSTPPAGISQADWSATPLGVRAGFLEFVCQLQIQQQENDPLCNSSQPPSCNGQGHKPPAHRKGRDRTRGGQQGHLGSGPELLPGERCYDVVDHHPEACRRCGTLLQEDDPEPYQHQVIEIPPITAQAIQHRLHWLICPCCRTST
jgi:transposase